MVTLVTVVTACSEMPGPTSAAQQAADTPDAAVAWLLGSWSCTSTYKTVPPYVAHTVPSVYVVTQDESDPETLHGSYAETADSADQVKWDEVWHVKLADGPDRLGRFHANIEVSMTDGTTIAADGTVSGPSGIIAGTSSLRGFIATPTLGTPPWSGGWSSLTGTPTRLFTSWSIGVTGGTQTYFGISCVPAQ